jgi:hypothetical protein
MLIGMAAAAAAGMETNAHQPKVDLLLLLLLLAPNVVHFKNLVVDSVFTC